MEGVAINFKCRICGTECPVAPEPPGQAICEDCCEDHNYQYDSGRRGKYCVHCDHELIQDEDW